ncbi:fimbrial protein [Pseudomonas mucidolens]|uniref:Pilin (Type 1 fimbria component protein) n=1 Tax=Pseudomonas mucidolens TaxID=46679 RepID=A0A1H2N942_9PSED|nr:fimbrial protein [Pseudomonas mucidolens]SDV02000.1 Pilin (type 1 fimbria component protein) [Pseudomonas mucidolens]SQH32390.1 putative fimbrial protein [Pseudomonas mucidolens]
MRTLNRQLGLLLLLLSGFSSVTQAELARINLHMTATLVAASCEVSVGSDEHYVYMGKWSVRQSTSALSTMPAARFVINLENCSGLKKGISVTFNGTANPTDPTLLALTGNGSAKNVAIALLDQNRSFLPLGRTLLVPAPGNESRTAALVFYSQYRATGPVTPGKGDADATFKLSYE